MVVYLRRIFYPEGFVFPIKVIPARILWIELSREIACLIMIIAVALLTGRKRWERFGYFLIVFGVWDIFYYVWLKVSIDWPQSLFEWDVLFLIPLPWIGPVAAPSLLAVLMIISGVLTVLLFERGREFRPTLLSWLIAIAATGLILFAFMHDTAATLRQQYPREFLYPVFMAGLLLYIVAFGQAYSKSINS